MKKNVSGQKWVVFAFNTTTNAAVAGDAANITANIRIDGGAANPIDDTNPTELEDGYYVFDLTNVETNGDLLLICPASSTGNVQVIGVPGAVWTEPLSDIADVVWDEVLTGATHNIASSAGRRLRNLDVTYIWSGTCQAGSLVNTIILDTGASAVNGTYDPGIIVIDGGTGIGQCRRIIDYNGTTKTCTINQDWRTIPDNTSTFVIYLDGGLVPDNEGAATGGGSNAITLNIHASSSNDIYNNNIIGLVSGTGKGQIRLISDYDGGTKIATVSEPWTIQPVEGTGYYIIQSGISDCDATAANQTTMIEHLTDIKGATFSSTTDSLEAISNAVSTISGGTGSNAITITVTDGSTPIQDVDVQIWNSDNDLLVTRGDTNSSGIFTTNLNDGTYTVRMLKGGCVFTNQTLTVDGVESVSYTGSIISIGTPTAPDACRCYEYCYMQDGTTPISRITANAIISTSPYDSGDELHYSLTVEGEYDSTTGLVYWDIVQGATVQFIIDEVGLDVIVDIPESTSARIIDIE